MNDLQKLIYLIRNYEKYRVDALHNKTEIISRFTAYNQGIEKVLELLEKYDKGELTREYLDSAVKEQ